MAKSAVEQSGNDQSLRDQWLGKIAQSQSSMGESVGALRTLRDIDSPSIRQGVLEHGPSVNANGASGGGAFADFDSLMQLIQTTVVPDTWEALGGNSTMAAYPQGIFVDPQGTVSVSATSQSPDTQDELANLRSVLTEAVGESNVDWRAPAAMRSVSFRRLRDAIAQRRITGQDLGDVIRNLGGLSTIQYVVFTDDDIVIAGPVGGILESDGWFVDAQSGMATMRLDFLSRSLKSCLSDAAFGCTIDPTHEGMQAAMQVASEIQIGKRPIAKAADDLGEALGMQNVQVFGAPGDNALALLMVEADRHMKQLALGVHPMPENAINYLDAVDQLIDQGPPSDLLLRLWFTANAIDVRTDQDQKVFELQGTPIRLSRENQRALANGGRGAVIADPRSELFVADFNRNWDRIRELYPIYSSLESLYRSAAIAQLIDQYGSSETHHQLAESLSGEEDQSIWLLHAPRQVPSIATRHTVRRGKQRHQIVLASGGVFISPDDVIDDQLVTYASLSDRSTIASDKPIMIQQWWWDLP
ncbi:DUF1598 domain-containing protein [Roseiconus sp. JC912]|uniref:DUF1598 domain-containing protein n=1 Tax=Roseiconus sp. JC912 TaxID=3396307 RepID=UPI003A4C79B5